VNSISNTHCGKQKELITVVKHTAYREKKDFYFAKTLDIHFIHLSTKRFTHIYTYIYRLYF